MKRKKAHGDNFIKIETGYPSPNEYFYINATKTDQNELISLQLFGIYPTWVTCMGYNIFRLSEVIVCNNLENLIEEDRKNYFSTSLRKSAFENFIGIELL